MAIIAIAARPVSLLEQRVSALSSNNAANSSFFSYDVSHHSTYCFLVFEKSVKLDFLSSFKSLVVLHLLTL
jgi:hypothetical protein